MRALHDFGGTVLFVSHDRYFVENIATRVILVKNGKVTDYPGDYHYYLNKLASEDRYASEEKAAAKSASKANSGKPAGLTKLADANAPKAAPAKAPAPAEANGSKPAVPGTAPKGEAAGGTQDWEAKKEAEKRKRKAEKRAAEVEAEIIQLDQKVATLDAELCLPETYADQALSQKLARDKQHAEAALAALYQELERLEAEIHGA
jgi:ATP-binding cassette, subfamily F, member 3